jgi:peptidoglycan/xylan/chitin deacetylase (PgdA/CDA1 family)
VKRTTLWALHRTGAFGALRHLRKQATPVLTYHGVMPGDDDRYDFLLDNFVSAAAFERQMRWLTSRYHPVSLRQIVDALDGGAPLPRGAATVTFDDGFANNFRVAFPILQRLGVPATIFLTTEKIGVAGAQLWTEQVKRAIYLTPRTELTLGAPDRSHYLLDAPGNRERAARAVLGQMKKLPVADRNRRVAEIEQLCGRPAMAPTDGTRYDFLTWDDVRVMAHAGVEFGSHTVSHPVLSTLSDAELETELRDSKARIEAELGRECYAFAYPNGKATDFGEREKKALGAAGYRCGLALQGQLNRQVSDRFALDRVNVAREFDEALLNARLTGALADLQRAKNAARALSPFA